MEKLLWTSICSSTFGYIPINFIICSIFKGLNKFRILEFGYFLTDKLHIARFCIEAEALSISGIGVAGVALTFCVVQSVCVLALVGIFDASTNVIALIAHPFGIRLSFCMRTILDGLLRPLPLWGLFYFLYLLLLNLLLWRKSSRQTFIKFYDLRISFLILWYFEPIWDLWTTGCCSYEL